MSQRETLFEPVPDRVSMAPASLANWERILPDVERREIRVLTGIFDYLEQTGAEDVSGAELSKHVGMTLLNVRPRLTELHGKSLIERGPVRASRVASEAWCHGYRPTCPRSAIQRWLELRADRRHQARGAISK